MHNHEDGQSERCSRRRPEPRRFVSLVQQFQREAKGRRAERDHSEATDKVLVRYTRRLGWATWAIAGAGILTFAAALLQWWVLSGQLGEMHQASIDTAALAKAARDQAAAAIAGERPWIKVIPDIIGNFEFYKYEDGDIIAKVPLGFDMKNVGKTPAIEAHVVAKPITYSAHILLDQKTLCDFAVETAITNTFYPDSYKNLTPISTTVFPDDVRQAAAGPLLIPSAEIKWYFDFIKGWYPEKMMPYVIGCAVYRSGFEDKRKWHKSGFIYTIFSDKKAITPSNGDIPAGDLGIGIGDARGFAAD